jgi:creatinine amidohydrolase
MKSTMMCAAVAAMVAAAHGKALVWEELTSDEIADAVETTRGTVLVPMGCVEKHNRHLPVGTDKIAAEALAKKAAEIEPVMVFPFGPYGAVSEARHHYGAVAISSETLKRLLDETCSELARNGFTNVVIVSEHGGNGPILDEFMRSRLDRPRNYNLYRWEDKYSSAQYKEWFSKFGKPNGAWGHACFYETSLMMELVPSLVHLERANVEEAAAKTRLDHFRKLRLSTPVDWYAQCDSQAYGDPSTASPELGKWLVATSVSNLVEAIRAVKADNVSSALRAEFDARCEKPER